ncbi:E3 ubiquitin-protein ligase RHA2A [Rhodamnia argentea]|uniref:E3 ubiquitin-protein ligase RHA2A n=1 Tax=Rhodamnia argentea TaxID=178133 RepID=A0ABM3HIM9_9MYRT|nr:E3 ubiquitin-protein ligase RHA2A [Rhodamnia argentea]
MLQSQLHDVSSDSIPLLLLAVVARSVHHLRSLLLALLHSLRLSGSIHPAASAPASSDAGLIGSGLAGLIVLADQLNQNRLSSRRCAAGPGGGLGAPDCVVCLSAMRQGEQVRELGCRHVFHKACLDGWLQHLNFSCPLCRSPLASSGEAVDAAGRRVGGELVEWFSLR